ncbi:hypothetical protein QE152_g964 [Popillia japonica]|uniref:Uncharacterized protein n=1 Tax=Popillia japonica TaxID=7064 RepID=A0AAW1N9F6_POPJA
MLRSIETKQFLASRVLLGNGSNGFGKSGHHPFRRVTEAPRDSKNFQQNALLGVVAASMENLGTTHFNMRYKPSFSRLAMKIKNATGVRNESYGAPLANTEDSPQSLSEDSLKTESKLFGLIVSSAKFVTQTKEALFSGLGVVLSVANCWNNIQIERTSVESWIGRLNQLGWFCQNWLKQDLHPSLSHGSIIVAILALKMDDSD